MSGRKYDVIILKWLPFKEKRCAYFGFPKESPLSKPNSVTELSVEMIHIQIMLSDVGYSNFKRLIAFCAEKE
jgi:hypothetical protein